MFVWHTLSFSLYIYSLTDYSEEKYLIYHQQNYTKQLIQAIFKRCLKII